MKKDMAISYPGSSGENCYWWFTVSRNGNKAFPTTDQQKAQLLLRRWQARFLMPDEQSSLAVASKQAGMSPLHFQRLYMKQVGISPKQYLMRKQLQMAKWFLRAHRIHISKVASATGFSSHGHFTSTFHRLIGVSPTEYRESFY